MMVNGASRRTTGMLDHGYMRHVLDDPSGLSQRAQRFLARHAERVPFEPAEGPTEAELKASFGSLPGSDIEAALTVFRHAQARYGGLRFQSVAWSFEEEITLLPWSWAISDYGPDDTELMADLLEHSTAHPYAVWLRGDGAVIYCFTELYPVEVPVFTAIDGLIEAEALYQECRTWKPIASDRTALIDVVEARAATLTAVTEGSGYTERWWEQDGFRVHVWRTFSALFRGTTPGRWGIWAEDHAGEQAARAFLAELGDQ